MILGEDEIRKTIPDFDLLKIDEVKSMFLEFYYLKERGDHQITDIYIVFTYPHEGITYLITLKLNGVRKLSLPEIGTYNFELGELDIYPIKEETMEDINYCIDDTLDGIFCYCKEVSFLNISKLENDDSRIVIWKNSESPRNHFLDGI